MTGNGADCSFLGVIKVLINPPEPEDAAAGGGVEGVGAGAEGFSGGDAGIFGPPWIEPRETGPEGDAPGKGVERLL